MRATLYVCLLAVGACTSDSTDDDEAPVDCTTVTGTDTFTVGLDKPGVSGLADFKLMSIDPAPAIRGDNTWIVEISGMANGVVGDPLVGADVSATPYMPAHMHGSSATVHITQVGDGSTGQYQITPVNLWMPGVWQTTIAITSGPNTDRAVYSFCVN